MIEKTVRSAPSDRCTCGAYKIKSRYWRSDNELDPNASGNYFCDKCRGIWPETEYVTIRTISVN